MAQASEAARKYSREHGEAFKAVTKTFAGLAGLVFMLLMISQFIAVFASVSRMTRRPTNSSNGGFGNPP
jgi:hypothetical protein